MIRLQNSIFEINSDSLLAPYFSFAEFAIDVDTVSRHNVYAEDTATSQNFFVSKITRDKTFTFHILCCHRSREQCHLIEIILKLNLVMKDFFDVCLFVFSLFSL